MIETKPADQLAEDARRGQEIFDRAIRSALRPVDQGKFVAIDVDTGNYEIDADDYAATTRLLARAPKSRMWLMRVGQETTYRIGRGTHLSVQ